MEKNYRRQDIADIAAELYSKVGGKKSIIQRIERKIPIFENGSFNYRDEDATLALVTLHFEKDVNEKLSYATDFRDILLKLAETNYFVEVVQLDKAWDQGGMMNIGHAWLEINKSPHFSKIFSPEQIKVIEEWMQKYATLLLRDKDAPGWTSSGYLGFRPYDNQEVGIGCMVILAQVLKNNFEISKDLMSLATSRVIGWSKKSGNPDDTLFYTPIWAKSVYFYACYANKLDWLKSDNCRNTFESFLQQIPGNGLTPIYNFAFNYSYPDMMALGAHIFQDGRYKWMANRLLQHKTEERPLQVQQLATEILEQGATKAPQVYAGYLKKREIDHLIQEEINAFFDGVFEGRVGTLFHTWLFWDDNLTPMKPQSGTMLLNKPGGKHWDPGPDLPDKIIFREGWDKDNLFALLNVRGEIGPHHYPGANELITLIYDQPFVIEEEPFELGARDMKLYRKYLNAFTLRKAGEWINDLGGPHLCNISFLNSLFLIDVSKTILSDYYNWVNERICMLVKGGYFLIFDHVYGPRIDKDMEVAVRWHLKGDYKVGYDRVQLKLQEKALEVLYPHMKGWYMVEARENIEMIPVYQHKASLNLDFISSETNAGFITCFYPLRANDSPIVQCINVEDSKGCAAFPWALGIKIKDLYEDIAGSRIFIEGLYKYGDIKTNSETFLIRHGQSTMQIYFTKGSLFAVKTVEEPKQVKLNGRSIAFKYSHQETTILLPDLQTGIITIAHDS